MHICIAIVLNNWNTIFLAKIDKLEASTLRHDKACGVLISAYCVDEFRQTIFSFAPV